MATPSALEYAQWQSEQRRAANQARMVNLAQLRQEAQRQRQSDAELMFREREGERDRSAALQRVKVAGQLDIEQEEARAKALMDRMDQQEKARVFRKFEQSVGPRLTGETDEQYFTRANKLLAAQAQSIFSNVDDYRRRATTLARREATDRAAKINRMAMQTVVPTLSKAEQAAVRQNPAAFMVVLEKNPGAAALYQSTLQRLDENTDPISPEGAIELQGLADESKRWEQVGSKLIGDDDFAGAMQYFARSQPTALARRSDLTRPGEGAAGVSAPAELSPPTTAPVPPVMENFIQSPLDETLGSQSPVIFGAPAPPRNPFAPAPSTNIFRAMSPQEQEQEFRLRRGLPAPRRPDMPFGTFTTPPELRF